MRTGRVTHGASRKVAVRTRRNPDERVALMSREVRDDNHNTISEDCSCVEQIGMSDRAIHFVEISD